MTTGPWYSACPLLLRLIGKLLLLLLQLPAAVATALPHTAAEGETGGVSTVLLSQSKFGAAAAAAEPVAGLRALAAERLKPLLTYTAVLAVTLLSMGSRELKVRLLSAKLEISDTPASLAASSAATPDTACSLCCSSFSLRLMDMGRGMCSKPSPPSLMPLPGLLTENLDLLMFMNLRLPVGRAFIEPRSFPFKACTRALRLLRPVVAPPRLNSSADKGLAEGRLAAAAAATARAAAAVAVIC